MSRGWWNALWIVLVCSSLACSKTDTPPAKTAGSGSAAGGLDMTPPEPGDDSGTARVTDKQGKSRTSAGIDDTDPFQGSAKNSPIEEGAPRKSLNGRWILVLTRPGEQGFVDFHTGIVVVAAGKGADADAGLTARWTAPSEVLPPSKLVSSEIDNKFIRLTFDIDGGSKLDFQGTLKEGVVYGNALFGNCLPARLLPTKAEALDDFNVSPEPTDTRALSQAFSQQDPKAALKAMAKFVSDRPQSPLGMMAWETRVMVSAIQDTAAEDIEQLIADYEQAMAMWGPRLQQTSQANVSIILAQTKYNPDFALKFVASADKNITDESLKELKEQLKTAREGILTVQALKYVESDDADRAGKAFAFLTKLRGKNPFDPAVLYGLARYQEKAKVTDEAIAMYAELVSLPMLEAFLQRDWSQKSGASERNDPNDVDIDGKPIAKSKKTAAAKRELPSATLAKLWEAKHGNTDGLDAFKDKTYHSRVTAFADPRTTEAPAGNKLVLCELFTGSSCPPCVGADIATGALEVTFPKTQVIVLRYHQHIPGPDPLTNSDSEDRFSNYYRGQGTPTVLLNGAPVNNVGGYLPNSPDIYRGLKSLIDQQLAAKSTVQVGVNARVVDGTLQLVASVTGLESLGDEAKDVRLRVVIAEDEVHFLARNGVRGHEMIVRQMVGGPAGVEPVDGKLSIKKSIPLAELKSSLANYLKKYEESEGIDFPAKPLDLKRLHIVAFVQNDESHEILQTNSIAVVAGGSAASTAITPASGKTAAKKVPVID